MLSQTAIQEGHKDVASLLLQNKKINVNWKLKEYGYSPLFMATYHSAHYIASLMLEHTKKIELESCHGGITSMHVACYNGDHEMVSLLMFGKLPVNERLQNSLLTPLYVACTLGHVGMYQRRWDIVLI